MDYLLKWIPLLAGVLGVVYFHLHAKTLSRRSYIVSISIGLVLALAAGVLAYVTGDHSLQTTLIWVLFFFVFGFGVSLLLFSAKRGGILPFLFVATGTLIGLFFVGYYIVSLVKSRMAYSFLGVITTSPEVVIGFFIVAFVGVVFGIARRILKK